MGKIWIQQKVSQRRTLKYFISAIRRNGFRIVFFFRLTPVPFGVQNGLFAISGISFRCFFLATFLGMLPEALLWIYFGSSARKIFDVLSGKSDFGSIQKILFIAQMVIAVVLFIVLLFVGRRIMKNAIAQEACLEREKEVNPISVEVQKHEQLQREQVLIIFKEIQHVKQQEESIDNINNPLVLISPPENT